MDITDLPPRTVQFLNEHDRLVDQNVEYEWLPIKCKNCGGYGHGMADCRNEEKVEWVKKAKNTIEKKEEKATEAKTEVSLEKHALITTISENKVTNSKIANSSSGNEANKSSTWQTPKKTVARRLNMRNGMKDTMQEAETSQQDKLKNAYEALQGQPREDFKGGFCTTFVYGSNSLEERKDLWKGLCNLKLHVKPWLILGDFNSVFYYSNRSGVKQVSKKEIEDSNNWLALGLVDWLSSSGSHFTWTNNQDGQEIICSRIDHVFKNEDWLDAFPNSSATFQWETTLDHCSCVVSSTQPQNIGVKKIRFFNFWSYHARFKETVMDNWTLPVRSAGLKAIYLKLMRLKHTLKRFNRDSIGDVDANFHKAKEHYQETRAVAQAHPKDPGFQKEKSDASKDYNFKAEVVDHFVKHFHIYLGSHSSANKKMDLSCIAVGNKLDVMQ
ncbi:hypothetical protein CsatB_023881 [Cannabis sativa]